MHYTYVDTHNKNLKKIVEFNFNFIYYQYVYLPFLWLSTNNLLMEIY